MPPCFEYRFETCSQARRLESRGHVDARPNDSVNRGLLDYGAEVPDNRRSNLPPVWGWELATLPGFG